MMDCSQVTITCMGKNFLNKNRGQQVGLAFQVSAKVIGGIVASANGVVETIKDLPFYSSMCPEDGNYYRNLELAQSNCSRDVEFAQSIGILITAGTVVLFGIGWVIERCFTPKEEIQQPLLERNNDGNNGGKELFV